MPRGSPEQAARASAAASRKAESRKAAELTARGWVCVPPHLVEPMRQVMREAGFNVGQFTEGNRQ